MSDRPKVYVRVTMDGDRPVFEVIDRDREEKIADVTWNEVHAMATSLLSALSFYPGGTK